MAIKERESLETRCVENLLVVYVYVLAISNRYPKDSSSAHKRLMTSWPPTQYLAPHLRLEPRGFSLRLFNPYGGPR